MRNPPRWTRVVKTFSVLSYLVKHCDPNGVELFVTSKPNDCIKAPKGKTRPLVRFLMALPENSTAAPGEHNLEASLSDILRSIENSKLAPSLFSKLSSAPRPKVSIYVLT